MPVERVRRFESDMVATATLSLCEADRAGVFGQPQLLDKRIGCRDGGEAVVIWIRNRACHAAFVPVKQVVEQLVGVGEAPRHGYSAATRACRSVSDIPGCAIRLAALAPAF